MVEHEGGYVNNVSDSGGATKYGITQGTWDEYRERTDLAGPVLVKDLTKETAVKFWEDYFRRTGLASPDLRYMGLMALAGAAGPGTALRAFRARVRAIAAKLSITYPSDLFEDKSSGLQDDERDWLATNFGPKLTQLAILATASRHFLRITKAYIEALGAGRAYNGSHGPKYILGWISRSFDPKYTKFLPLRDKAAVAKMVASSVESLRAMPAAEQPLSRWDGSQWVSLGGKRIKDIMLRTRSNWMHRDRELQNYLVDVT